MAAKHYLINSTGQINPKVVKALKGDKGATGPAGLQGKEGPADKAAEGPAGKEGPPGKDGVAGKNGAPGATKIVTRYGPEIALAPERANRSYAACLAGEAVTGGGYAFPGLLPLGAVRMFEDRAATSGTFNPAPENGEAASGWVVDIENTTTQTFNFQAYVQCASP
jgi:hypothetical protein